MTWQKKSSSNGSSSRRKYLHFVPLSLHQVDLFLYLRFFACKQSQTGHKIQYNAMKSKDSKYEIPLFCSLFLILLSETDYLWKAGLYFCSICSKFLLNSPSMGFHSVVYQYIYSSNMYCRRACWCALLTLDPIGPLVANVSMANIHKRFSSEMTREVAMKGLEVSISTCWKHMILHIQTQFNPFCTKINGN